MESNLGESMFYFCCLNSLTRNCSTNNSDVNRNVNIQCSVAVVVMTKKLRLLKMCLVWGWTACLLDPSDLAEHAATLPLSLDVECFALVATATPPSASATTTQLELHHDKVWATAHSDCINWFHLVSSRLVSSHLISSELKKVHCAIRSDEIGMCVHLHSSKKSAEMIWILDINAPLWQAAGTKKQHAFL